MTFPNVKHQHISATLLRIITSTQSASIPAADPREARSNVGNIEPGLLMMRSTADSGRLEHLTSRNDDRGCEIARDVHCRAAHVEKAINA